MTFPQIIKGSFWLWFRVQKPGQPGGCLMVPGWTKKTTYYHIHIIAFCRKPKLKIFRGKKVDTQTKEANAKKWNQSQKNLGLKKRLFWGAP